MDQGVVEEWLSEFKVCVGLCPSKKISEQVNEFAVFQPLTCVLQTLPDSAISSYAASLKDKAALVPALYKVIRENYSDVWTHASILNTSCRKISKGPWLAFHLAKGATLA